MNKKTYKVVKGYSELSYSERQEAKKAIDDYENKTFENRDKLIKGLYESVGPLDQDNCPCCGR